MSLTTAILLVLALYMVQIFLQETSRFGFDLRGIVGNRDHPPEMSIIAGRLERAKNNMQEALPFFLALALLALVKGGGTNAAVTGATIFLGARILYVPAYMTGIALVRSLLWLAANAGLVVMALSLI